jgi:hypothetical protein
MHSQFAASKLELEIYFLLKSVINISIHAACNLISLAVVMVEKKRSRGARNGKSPKEEVSLPF